jgi:hypothetical protein
MPLLLNLTALNKLSTLVRTIRALTAVNAMPTAAAATPAHASPDFRAPTARQATHA